MKLSVAVPSHMSTAQATAVKLTEWETGFRPQTDLGRRLAALRAEAIASGMVLLSAGQIREELRLHRGEVRGRDSDIC
jgi:hypothetical protein